MIQVPNACQAGYAMVNKLNVHSKMPCNLKLINSNRVRKDSLMFPWLVSPLLKMHSL